MPTKKHDIYLRAAKMAAEGGNHWDGCCRLIAEAARFPFFYDECPQTRAFARRFRPRGKGGFWMEDDMSEPIASLRNRRILALLFAHQLHLDGQLP